MRIPALPKTNAEYLLPPQPLLKSVQSAVLKKIKKKKQFVAMPRRN